MTKQQYVLIDGAWIPTGGAPGVPGSPGQDGTDGAQGPQGPPGATYLNAQWNFNQNTVASPANGTMRMDATTYAAATVLWVSEQDRDGLDRSIGLSLAVPGDQIIMQSAQGRAVWNIVSQADSGTYRTFTVTLAESSGNRPSASSPTTLYFVAVGSEPVGIPAGGTTGQVLAKDSADDFDAIWTDVAASGGGYADVWSSTVAYPAGSIVVYDGYTWGAADSVAAGQSAPTTVTTDSTLIPAGTDLIANALSIHIGTNGANVSSAAFPIGSYTTEASEPGPSNKSSWWYYTPNNSGSVQFTTVGSGGDTIMALYSRSGSGAITFAQLTQVAFDDDAGGGGTSAFTYSVVGGTTYYIQIGTYSSGASFNVILNINGGRATDPPAGSAPWTLLGTSGTPKILVLGPSDPVPGGTPAGTVIVRTT
jgi:hypothetical protein